MPTPLKLYKSFVDDLVGTPRNSVGASRARRGVWNPNRPSRKDSEILRRSLEKDQQYNQLLRELSAGQREVLAQMLQEEHNSGVFAVLSYLADEINLGGLRLSRDGVEFPVEPFGTELYYDWTSRCDGDTWPDERNDGA
jgi:hypothetical protein